MVVNDGDKSHGKEQKNMLQQTQERVGILHTMVLLNMHGSILPFLL